MKSKRIFQIFVLLALVFSPLGSNQTVRAGTVSVDELNAIVIDRNLDYWDNNYLGYASSSIYENWWLGLEESHNFIVTVSPFLGDLVPLLILLDAEGNELARGIGTITSAQPAGDYSILVQPQTGAGFYFLLLREVAQTEPLTTILLDPSSLNAGETAVATVSLNNVPAEGYTSAEFTCFYDSNVVEVSNIVVPNRFGPDPAVAISGPHSLGNSFIVAIAGSHGNKATTSGTAFTFNLKGLQAGHSAIECTARVSKGDKVLVELPSIGSRLTVLGIAPTSTPTAATRITIDPGQTTASRIGVINPNETIRYLLNAGAGQVLSINLTAPANEVALGVTGPTGLVLKPLDASLTWSTTISTGGDHTITLISLTGSSSKSYTLQVSLTPPAATATPTATPTVDPHAFCDKVQLIADVTVPDGTTFPPGATFTKTWRLKNVGSCTWTTSYQLVFFSGEQMGAPSSAYFPISVAPGQTIDISLHMTAPSSPGSYRGYWIFKNANGALFGMGAQANEPWWVDIRVSGATATPTFSPTPCDKAEFVADINVPPGTVMAPGAQFTKTWRLKNVGTCTWTLSYRIALLSGDQMGAPSSVQLPTNVAPGQMVDLSLNMTAPSTPGSYRGYWIFQNSTGSPFGIGPLGNQPWFVDIVIADGTVTPTGTQPSSILRLTKSASPPTYSGPDQTITYTFTITNTGTTALGPAQFTITDNQLSAPFNCGPADVTLAPNQSLSCSMNYKTTSEDMALPNIINSATAAGAGQVSPPATALVTNLAAPATPTPNITPTAPTATPSLGTAYDFAANACAAVWSSGAGGLLCPGIEGDPKGFVLKLSNPRLETGATDTRPGLLTFPQNVQNGYIQGFYPPIRVQNGDRFRSTLTCEYGATNCYVAFRLDYQIGSDPIKTFWGPFLERYEGQYFSVDVDLSSLSGKDVKFILTVLAAGQATGDRALWVGPIIYRAGSISTPTSEVSPTSTPTSTMEGSWLPFQVGSYGFRFLYPSDAQLVEGSRDNYARINLPFVSGTNLSQKYVEMIVTENATPCRSPLATSSMLETSETIVINGLTFLKEIGQDGTAGHINKWIAYSTARNNACVSLDFVLRSANPGVFTTPPPLYDEVAESLVFSQIVSTFAWLTSTEGTGTPMPAVGLLMGKVFASKLVRIEAYNADNNLVGAGWANPDGSFEFHAPSGTNSVIAMANGFLSAQRSVTITDGSTTTLPTITLIAGDIDGNNVIDQFDALTIGINYNTSNPDAADLNNDGIINVLDLELLAKNYRSMGPVAWP